MRSALAIFNSGILNSRQHSVLHEYLALQVRVPLPFDDLLRGQIITAVAAFDKLIHDVIRIGMCDIFCGRRSPTPKYQNESISIQLHTDLASATVPPKEYYFERAIVSKLSRQSFQHPDMISDGLALIWNEKQKWQKIGVTMGVGGNLASTQMKLIVGRRNAMVHESDMDPLTNHKASISRAETDDMTNFLALCGNSIVSLVS